MATKNKKTQQPRVNGRFAKKPTTQQQKSNVAKEMQNLATIHEEAKAEQVKKILDLPQIESVKYNDPHKKSEFKFQKIANVTYTRS